MKGIEISTNILIGIVVFLILASILGYVLITYFDVNSPKNVATPLARDFCLKMTDIKYIGKYVGGLFCNLFG